MLASVQRSASGSMSNQPKVRGSGNTDGFSHRVLVGQIIEAIPQAFAFAENYRHDDDMRLINETFREKATQSAHSAADTDILISCCVSSQQ